MVKHSQRGINEPKVLNLVPKSVSILHAAKTIVLQSCDVENTSEVTSKQLFEAFAMSSASS